MQGHAHMMARTSLPQCGVYLIGRNNSVCLTEMAFDLKTHTHSDAACSDVVLLPSVISLAYQVQQFNRNLETDYSDLFT